MESFRGQGECPLWLSMGDIGGNVECAQVFLECRMAQCKSPPDWVRGRVID